MVPSKTQRIVGWGITILIALFLIGVSAVPKFIDWEGKEEMFQKLGFTTELMFKIGIVEATCALLYLIPRTSFLGAILLTGYLGGATVTHVRINEPFFFPVILGIVMWIGCALRYPQIFALLLGRVEVRESRVESQT